MNHYLELGLQVIVFLSLSYLIFFKAFLKAFAKEKAKLVTTSELTSIKESVKTEFNKKIESLRAELAKNNINYQITLTELTKKRFESIEILMMNLIELQDYIIDNMFAAENDEQYNQTKLEFNRLYRKTENQRKLSNLYIPEDIAGIVLNATNSTYAAYLAFLKIYKTDPKNLRNNIDWTPSASLIKEKLSKENFKAYEKLNDSIDYFPKIINKLSSELRNEMFLKGLK